MSPTRDEKQSIEIVDDETEETKTVPKGFDALGRPLEDVSSDVTVPRGFDKDGHPLDGPKIQQNPQVYLLPMK